MFLLHPKTTKPHHCLSQSKLTHCFVWEKEQSPSLKFVFFFGGWLKETVFNFPIYMCVYIGERREMRKDCRRVSKMKGRISKIGSYAISSSIRDQQQHQQPCITCTTFNILAPIYKRLNREVPFCYFFSYVVWICSCFNDF